jgi:chromosome segregation ATPase
VVSRNERRARERQDEVTRLEAALAEGERAKTLAKADLGGRTRWRDRNRFVNALLHGELAVYEQTAPRWRKYKHARKEVARTTRRLSAARKGLDAAFDRVIRDDRGWKKRTGTVAAAKAVLASAERLLDLIKKARTRVEQAGRRGHASRALVDQDSQEVAELLRAVRTDASKLNDEISPNLRGIAKLELVLSGGEVDPKVRVRERKTAKAALDSLAREVTSAIGNLRERVGAAEEELASYVRSERVRFDEREQ